MTLVVYSKRISDNWHDSITQNISIDAVRAFVCAFDKTVLNSQTTRAI